jgi:hypothetical protein
VVTLLLTFRVQLFWVIFKLRFSLCLFFSPISSSILSRELKIQEFGRDVLSIVSENFLKTSLNLLLVFSWPHKMAPIVVFQITMKIHISAMVFKSFSELNI